MYGSNVSGRKQKSGTAGYLARPKLGALKILYSSKIPPRPFTSYGYDKRKKTKKPNEPRIEFRRRPDYADTAHRDAVSRLRILLAESYAPIKRTTRELDSAGEETDNQSLLSGASRNSRPSHIYYRSSPLLSRIYPYYTPVKSTYNVLHGEPEKNIPTEPPTKWENNQNQPLLFRDHSAKWETNQNHAPPELLSFIERQEEYIEQLERESRFCIRSEPRKDELSTLLRKVKDVISENENLHEKQKTSLIKSVFNHLETETETENEGDIGKNNSPKKARRHYALEGPTIVFESRISELEAQLTQCKIDLRKAIDENETFKRKISDGSLADAIGLDTYRKQIDTLQRERNTLQDSVSKLQSALTQLRNKETDTTDQVKRSLDAVEHAQYEKNAAELEIRRLKDDLERQHGKLRESISEQNRRIADERSAVERRYTQQIEQLTTELGVHWETTSKLQLELDKQRRENSDLRREIAQKQAYIDELKNEMQHKIASLQSDIGVNGAEKSSLEQQIATLHIANERNERQTRQEAVRLQAEMQSLRQRLDRADADLIHSRRENLRLNEQVASLEKEINLHAALSDERNKRGMGEIIALPPPAPTKEDREKELSSRIKDMENKHAATVAELEGMIHTQNQLMDKLTGECHTLTNKLDDTSFRHKEEIRELHANLDYLNSRFSNSQSTKQPPQYKGEEHDLYSTQRAPYIPIAQNQGSVNSPSNKILSRTNSNASVKSIPQRLDNSPYPNNNKPTSQQPIDTQKIKTSNVPPRKPSIDLQRQLETSSHATRKPSIDLQDQFETSVRPPRKPSIDQQQLDSGAPKPINPQDEGIKTETQAYSTEPNQQYDQQYSADLNNEYAQQLYSTEPLQEYDATDPSQYDQQYTDQQYPYDPNQPNQAYMTQEEYDQYATDPNAQYAMDPNAQYTTDPNTQYTGEQYPSDLQYEGQSEEQYGNGQQYSTEQYGTEPPVAATIPPKQTPEQQKTDQQK